MLYYLLLSPTIHSVSLMLSTAVVNAFCHRRSSKCVLRRSQTAKSSLLGTFRALSGCPISLKKRYGLLQFTTVYYRITAERYVNQCLRRLSDPKIGPQSPLRPQNVIFQPILAHFWTILARLFAPFSLKKRYGLQQFTTESLQSPYRRH